VIQACETANPHGAGVAWREKGKVRWFKNLSAEEVSTLLPELDGELVIHFRWASVGGVDPLLCHPFPIAPDSPLAIEGKATRVLFHNGTWGNWQEGLACLPEGSFEGAVSDTRVMAMLLAGLKETRCLRRIEGRWVVFGAKTTRFYGQWRHWRGMECSNLGFVYELERELRDAARFEGKTGGRRRKKEVVPKQLGLWEESVK